MQSHVTLETLSEADSTHRKCLDKWAPDWIFCLSGNAIDHIPPFLRILTQVGDAKKSAFDEDFEKSSSNTTGGGKRQK